MKMLERAFILQFLFLFIIPVAFAEITITLPEKDVYNLGEKVAPSVLIKQDRDYGGFFKLYIFCDNYDLQYYTIPLDLEAGLRMELTVPDLPLSKSMAPQCKLKSNFEASDGESIDTALSKDFFVVDGINITMEGDLEAKPGEDITLTGKARKYSNELLSKGEAKISFRSGENKVEVGSGKFEHTIHLDNSLEAGDIPLLVAVTDKYGNYGDKILMVKVLPIPTKIENRFEKGILTPGDSLKAKITLYDHTGRVINGSEINVKIFNPEGKIIAEKGIQSLSYLEFQTEKIQVPGDYILLSAFENVKEQSSFTVQSLRKITMRQEENFVHIENIGNVGYDDETTIILENNGKKYLVNKKIGLKPGEKIVIDLSKEVPQGSYDITLPAESIKGDTGAADSANGSISAKEIAEQANVIKDVPIDDNRNIIKKTADGMSLATGAVVRTAGYVASRPTLAAITLILIILGTVTYYSRGFIINKIKNRKPNDTSHLFKDFKFK